MNALQPGQAPKPIPFELDLEVELDFDIDVEEPEPATPLEGASAEALSFGALVWRWLEERC